MAIKELLAQYHHPEFVSKPEGGDGAHVCEVWEDGEITLTKGGSLYLQRNLHCIVPPFDKSLPLEDMPRLNGSRTHGNVVVKYEERAIVRQIIADALGVEDPYKGLV